MTAAELALVEIAASIVELPQQRAARLEPVNRHLGRQLGRGCALEAAVGRGAQVRRRAADLVRPWRRYPWPGRFAAELGAERVVGAAEDRGVRTSIALPWPMSTRRTGEVARAG